MSDIKISMWYYLPNIRGLKAMYFAALLMLLLKENFIFLKYKFETFSVFFSWNCWNLNFMKSYLWNLSKSITNKSHLCFNQHSVIQTPNLPLSLLVLFPMVMIVMVMYKSDKQFLSGFGIWVCNIFDLIKQI